MFWLMRCALVIGLLYWLSPLRAPDPHAPDWRAVETHWRDGSDKLRGLALESVRREAALGALSALRRPAEPERRPAQP